MAEQRILNEHMKKTVLLALKSFSPDETLGTKEISCAEAVEALQHTIDFIEKKVPLNLVIP